MLSGGNEMLGKGLLCLVSSEGTTKETLFLQGPRVLGATAGMNVSKRWTQSYSIISSQDLTTLAQKNGKTSI